jgi:hypothetical protein
MKRTRVPDRDNLFRHAVHPVTFKSKRFAAEKFIHLVEQKDGSLLASLAWERFLPRSIDVHKYGCRLASSRNAIPTSRKRSVYCGAYHLKARTIRALPSEQDLREVTSIEIEHKVEHGEIAHIDLRFVIRGQEDLNIEGSKTAIIAGLWNICSGPMQHVCEGDQDIDPHPSSLLMVPFRGPYNDDRSALKRWYCRIMCHVYRWLLRKEI